MSGQVIPSINSPSLYWQQRMAGMDYVPPTPPNQVYQPDVLTMMANGYDAVGGAVGNAVDYITEPYQPKVHQLPPNPTEFDKLAVERDNRIEQAYAGTPRYMQALNAYFTPPAYLYDYPDSVREGNIW